MSIESWYVETMLQGRSSVNHTDAYKFSMAEAGFPLRKESFYLSYRKGGPLYNPFDLKQVVTCMLPIVHKHHVDQLAHMGFHLTPAMRVALSDTPQIYAAPKGSWIGPGEPILRLTGPSFLVSWFEPLLVALHFPLQIATAILSGQTNFTATCIDEGQIIRMVAYAFEKSVNVIIDEDAYKTGVRRRLSALAEAFGERDWAERCFEVGMRSASCMQRHDLCVAECHSVGIKQTSNVYLASKRGLAPVGTMGHEHLMRWGYDLAGFRAMRDMRYSPPTYLVDTFDAQKLGIPGAVKALKEDPSRSSFVRFDSGDQAEQMHEMHQMCERESLDVRYILEDGYDVESTRKMEKTRKYLGISATNVLYGYGGYLVDGGEGFSRDKVQMVYKLCKTGGKAVMKVCGDKSSIPGSPVTLVDITGNRLIAQEGEDVEGFFLLSSVHPRPEKMAAKSPETTKSSGTDALEFWLNFSK